MKNFIFNTIFFKQKQIMRIKMQEIIIINSYYLASYVKALKILAMGLVAGAFLFLSGCATTFGVKEEVWKTLSKEQKEKVIDEYYKNQREEKLIEKKRREAQLKREERLLNSLDKDAYLPDKILYGKLFAGEFRYDDTYYHYEPVYFSIAYGEIKSIPIRLSNGKLYQCYIEYGEEKFLLDVSPEHLARERARTFPVNDNTKEGVHFSSFSTSNMSSLDGRGLHLNLRVFTEKEVNRNPYLEK